MQDPCMHMYSNYMQQDLFSVLQEDNFYHIYILAQ